MPSQEEESSLRWRPFSHHNSTPVSHLVMYDNLQATPGLNWIHSTHSHYTGVYILYTFMLPIFTPDIWSVCPTEQVSPACRSCMSRCPSPRWRCQQGTRCSHPGSSCQKCRRPLWCQLVHPDLSWSCILRAPQCRTCPPCWWWTPSGWGGRPSPHSLDSTGWPGSPTPRTSWTWIHHGHHKDEKYSWTSCNRRRRWSFDLSHNQCLWYLKLNKKKI